MASKMVTLSKSGTLKKSEQLGKGLPLTGNAAGFRLGGMVKH
jgi:hypothetical protein